MILKKEIARMDDVKIAETAVTPEAPRGSIFNREKLIHSLRFYYLKPLKPLDAIGTVAKFEVAIPHLLQIRGCELRRRPGEALRLSTSRMENSDDFAVELPKWLRAAILKGAIARLRAKLEHDDAAEVDDAAGLARFIGAEKAA
jgi:hypothetical protein